MYLYIYPCIPYLKPDLSTLVDELAPLWVVYLYLYLYIYIYIYVNNIYIYAYLYIFTYI